MSNAHVTRNGLVLLHAGLVFILLASTGCSLSRSASYSEDNAFVTYSPRPDGRDALRLAVKDSIDVKGSVSSAGSQHFARQGKPAAEDAACLRIARERNVWIVGKTNLGELGLGVSGANDYYGTPENPYRPKMRFVPGGSSSGSAVAVATGMADVALGTDTAGSIRVPAACCGIAGLKTTYGLVPLEGVYPVSEDTLDTVGPLAPNVEGLVSGMDLLERGFAREFRKVAAQKSSPRSITVGRLYVPGTKPEIDAAIDNALASAGFRVVRLSDKFVRNWEQAEKDGRTIAESAGWMTDHPLLDEPGISGITKAAIRLGHLSFQSGYEQAIARRPIWQQILENEFNKVDLIATPTLTGQPPRITFLGRTATLELRMFDVQNTVAVNFAGNPALAIPVPAAFPKAPLASLQLIGPPRSEKELLHAGQIVEANVWKSPLGEWALARDDR